LRFFEAGVAMILNEEAIAASVIIPRDRGRRKDWRRLPRVSGANPGVYLCQNGGIPSSAESAIREFPEGQEDSGGVRLVAAEG
jgi:hypothetical protein